jgi:hypothetical protein
MTDDSGPVVAREQSLQGFATVFPVEAISEITPLCVRVDMDVGAAVYTRWIALSWFKSIW